MNIYLDTANVKDIKEAVSQGAVDGITTNPSLAAKEGRDFKELVLEICHLVDGPVSAEVISIEADAIVNEGRELAKLHTNVVVKCPLMAGHFSGKPAAVTTDARHAKLEITRHTMIGGDSMSIAGVSSFLALRTAGVRLR